VCVGGGDEKDTPNVIWKYSKEDRTRKIWLLMEGEFFSPNILQSVRGHSAIVLTVTINGMQQIHPVIYLLFF